MKHYFVVLGLGILCVLGGNANAQATLPTPENIRTEAHQREIVLRWKSAQMAGIKWEVVVNDQAPFIVAKNKCVVTGLQPNSENAIELRAVKGNEYSDFATVSDAKTKPLTKGVNDIRRIPYLWTLATRSNSWGTVSKLEKLGLFYDDLATANAKITYSIDGETVTPTGDYLIFEKTGKQKLTVTIEENKDRVWKLAYFLNIID